jgi:hypothetical protein
VVRVAGFWRETISPLWTKSPRRVVSETKHALNSCQYPPTWNRIVGASFEYRVNGVETIWNRAHPLVAAVSTEAWQWSAQAFRSGQDPLELRDGSLKDRANAAAWILRMLCTEQDDVWNGLVERAPHCVQDLWNVLFPRARRGALPPGLALWVQKSHDSLLYRVMREGWSVLHADGSDDRAEIEKWMPDPGPDWTVQVDRKKTHPAGMK